ncbi:CoA transferase [Burkholderiaceae bacterium FT117]|uniref:CaiB/BaiF CoA transferase family protein n=1 Tax=Zeimonas sediminis TaxID=2944268 RepID=UPI002342F6B9|nr:CaiB/BaiF CoA-transferase family protein [Zeimonas sediminis]MCM5572213.1 CoA transferase [Zeimonas sediminis]
MSGPLSHIKVLDLSRVLAGPWAGQNLADMGADVIKIERPVKGDDSRAFGPPWMKDADGKDTSEAAYFCAANRGKRSLTADISKPEAQEMIRKLAAKCDVVIENYKYGDLARYGLGYEDIKAVNPGIVYCSITGFGQTGPWKERPGYDFMAQGMSGLMSITGSPESETDRYGVRFGVPIIDILTGMYGTIAICAALAHRAETGKGQHLDISLLDSALALTSIQGMNWIATGESPGRIGNAHPNIVPYQVFPTADGSVIVACGNDNLYRKYCAAAGHPELADDPRFATNAKRVENRAIITPILDGIMKRKTTKEWCAILDEAGVANGPINTIGQAFEEPQAVARGALFDIPHPLAGTARLIASPLRFSETPVEYAKAPPVLGQHSEEILQQELGLSADEIAALRANKVI